MWKLSYWLFRVMWKVLQGEIPFENSSSAVSNKESLIFIGSPNIHHQCNNEFMVYFVLILYSSVILNVRELCNFQFPDLPETLDAVSLHGCCFITSCTSYYKRYPNYNCMVLFMRYHSIPLFRIKDLMDVSGIESK